jgi:hypothetical protein
MQTDYSRKGLSSEITPVPCVSGKDTQPSKSSRGDVGSMGSLIYMTHRHEGGSA